MFPFGDSSACALRLKRFFRLTPKENYNRQQNQAAEQKTNRVKSKRLDIVHPDALGHKGQTPDQ
ncbi:hypothetical protein SDC9_203641 [bioreactor metagenome]|uniref:Uncharacterized protein n=1 Tax=bioreactor metagenome TaxID=1076179 RepID=A0A645IXT5_9ZZZZ